jgi:hypothetical protein
MIELTELDIPDSTTLEGAAESGAVFSWNRTYRYVLWRVWDPFLPVMVWVMLNPSTASAELDDPTIRKCRGFAQRQGYGGIIVVNLFAFRSTKPDILRNRLLSHIKGPDNLACMEAVAKISGAKRLWCGWGASLPELTKPRVAELCPFLVQFSLLCFGTSKDGSPRHPLMLPYASAPQAWSIPTSVV